MDRSPGEGRAGGQEPLAAALKAESHLRAIANAAIEAADPRQAVHGHLSREGNFLRVARPDGSVRIPLPDAGRGRVILVGAGKGSAPMAQAVEEVLGDRLWGGLICVKDGHGCPTQRVEVVEAAHPVPDARGLQAAERILGLVREARDMDLVISVLSGGGSALLTLPAEGVSLGDLQTLTDLLLSCGASIGEVNTLRKHLSRVKGGRLALAAEPAPVLNLVLSDVVGDRLEVIASGPFTADPTTFGDCREILTRYELWDRAPAPVRSAIEGGERGDVPETPKKGHTALARVVHAVVGSNRLSLEAAARQAREFGYQTVILTSQLEGEAREAARFLAAVAKECQTSGDPVSPPACVLAGGETTVTLRGRGRGGRNQELALALALELDGGRGIAGLSAGTDGTDGPTDAAGAWVDHRTVARARALGVDPRAALAANDSYAFFDRAGGLLRTGPTRTNVMDVQILLVAP